ncbi:MAG: DUF87 domain-containing protein [Candidatus Dojkabacteria bacterium]|nr:MAG: DUF87 domain-containing protein [Candidatus Dojkabacteria bacterium]
MILILAGVIGAALLLLLVVVLNRPKENAIFPGGTQTMLQPEEMVVLRIAIPRNNDKTPLAAEQMFASLHGLYKDTGVVNILSLEMYSDSKAGVRFHITLPNAIANFVKTQVYAQYPNAEIAQVDDYMQESEKWGTSAQVSAGEIVFERPFIFPIKSFRDFDVDPLSAIAGSISELFLGEEAWLQIVVRPYPNIWQKTSQQYVKSTREGVNFFASKDGFWGGFFGIITGFFGGIAKFLLDGMNTDPSKPIPKPVTPPAVKLEHYQEEEIKKVEMKAEKAGFQCAIRVLVKSEDPNRAIQVFDGIVASFRQYATAHLNTLVLDGEKSSADVYYAMRQRAISETEQNIFNIEELASLYHLPNTYGTTSSIFFSTTGKLPPPGDLEYEEGVIFGKTDYRGDHRIFGINKQDQRRHMYIIGKSGTGKSSLMKNMIVSDIMNGEGVGVVDPHGELAEFVLDYVPEHRINDVVYFNPGDTEFPIGFNPLYLKDRNQRDLVADGVVAVFKKYFDSWGPRLEYMLYNAILTALESQGTTLLSIQRMLVDKAYRKRVLSHVRDPIVLRFWRDEFVAIEENKKMLTEAIAPIQNKIGRYLSPRIVRNILGQVKSTINMREVLDNKKIFIMNLSKGRIGEENSALLGGLLITRLYTTAMERVDMLEHERPDFSLYIDEFQSFTTDAFVNILSEARKYHLGLTMAHQFIEQLPIQLRAGIFGNVGSMVAFSVSQKDAYVLSQEFAPYVTSEDFLSLPNWHMYMRMVINDRISEPFSAKSLPFRYSPQGFKEAIKEASRQQYAVPRADIEEKLNRWATQTGAGPEHEPGSFD